MLLWNQATDWPAYEDAARRVDQLGYDHLWAWDHLYAIFGEPLQPIFEGWMSLAAWAKATEHVRLGLLVGANTFRNPGLTAKLATTLDHMSNGRAILGVGGAWFDTEHQATGIEFGRGVGQRLDWMDEAVAAMRTLLDGGTVTSPPDGHYQFDDLVRRRHPSSRGCRSIGGGRGEEDAAIRGALCRHVERHGHAGFAAPQGRGAPRPLRGGRLRPGRDPTHGRLQADHPRHG